MLQFLLFATSPKIVAPAHPNLVINGNFSAGNKGFTSGYQFDASNVETDGFYSVGADPHSFHPGGLSMGDHTTGKGLMLIVNGSQTDKTAVWQQIVKVQPNHKYSFGLWAASWSESLDGATDASPANLVVSVNGKSIGAPFKVTARSGIWTKFSATWTSGSAKSATLKIVDNNLNAFGNDFAIDDIVFHI